MTLRRRTPLQRKVPLVNRTSMRRTPLTRRVPLERGTELASVVPLKRSPMKRSRVVPKLTKQQAAPIIDRSGGICELQTVDCVFVAVDPCHRLGEGMGGRHGEAAEANDRPSNVLLGCRRCHDWCHMNRAEAERERFMLRNGDIPLATPVHYRRARWVLLDDVGGMEQCPAPAGEVA
jgi:hypothetical protein